MANIQGETQILTAQEEKEKEWVNEKEVEGKGIKSAMTQENVYGRKDLYGP